MAIPDSVRDKFDNDPTWAIQHEDIIRIMDETKIEKPWSRYMIQQHLNGSPAKKTVQNRLDELVELGILDKYEYSNQTLYDLAYDPIVTDGGRLKDANLMELVTLQDRNGVRDLVSGAILLTFLFLGLGILTEATFLTGEVQLSSNIFIDTAIILYLVALAILLPLFIVNRLESLLLSRHPQDDK